jgi:hypothetical protein
MLTVFGCPVFGCLLCSEGQNTGLVFKWLKLIWMLNSQFLNGEKKIATKSHISLDHFVLKVFFI